MLSRLILATVVGIFVALVCMLVGALLTAFSISWVTAVGSFLQVYSGLLGLLAALWYFFAGHTYWPNRP